MSRSWSEEATPERVEEREDESKLSPGVVLLGGSVMVLENKRGVNGLCHGVNLFCN